MGHQDANLGIRAPSFERFILYASGPLEVPLSELDDVQAMDVDSQDGVDPVDALGQFLDAFQLDVSSGVMRCSW